MFVLLQCDLDVISLFFVLHINKSHGFVWSFSVYLGYWWSVVCPGRTTSGWGATELTGYMYSDVTLSATAKEISLFHTYNFNSFSGHVPALELFINHVSCM